MKTRFRRITTAGALATALIFGLAGPAMADNGEPWFDFYPANWTILSGSPYVNLGTLQLNLNYAGTDAVMNTTPSSGGDPEESNGCTTVDHRFNYWWAYRMDFDLVILGPRAPAGHPTDKMWVEVRDITRHFTATGMKGFAPGDPYLTSSYGHTLPNAYGSMASYGNDLPVWSDLHETIDLTAYGTDQIQVMFVMNPGSKTTIFQLVNPQLYNIGAMEDIGPCYGPWHPYALP